MRVNGQWLPGEDAVLRPIVPGVVRLADGGWLEVSFLLDAGADRTVFSARFLHRLQELETAGPEQMLLSGVGGAANSITVETAIGFVRDDGRLVTVRGSFGVFTEGESADLSVLGRDVTNTPAAANGAVARLLRRAPQDLRNVAAW
ncbi:MAG: hypothetical protein ACREBC_22990 [Pyrinomonadaceae bacterium]